MPVYEYVALNPAGRNTKGTIDADNARVARQRLRGQGLFPTSLNEVTESSRKAQRDIRALLQSNRVGLKDLGVMTRQLATLVNAGLPIVDALQALTDQTDSAALKRIVVQIRENVEGGTQLAKAISSFPQVFPNLYINMVASGEASGTLDNVLENLADELESQLALRRKVTSALFYPVLMFGFCVLVVTVLLVFVVPSIIEIFTKQNIGLPLPTQILLAVSDALIHWWPVFIVTLIIAILGMQRWYRTDSGRAKVDRFLLRAPLYGGLTLKIQTARFSRTLSTLLAGGVGLLTALDIVQNILGNVHLRKAITDAKEGVREGRNLSRELAKSGEFPTMLTHMIAVGERSGQLEPMLAKAGRAYENEVNATLSGLTSLIEPLMMVFLGAIVFSIVIAMLLPMTDLMSKLSF